MQQANMRTEVYNCLQEAGFIEASDNTKSGRASKAKKTNKIADLQPNPAKQPTASQIAADVADWDVIDDRSRYLFDEGGRRASSKLEPDAIEFSRPSMRASSKQPISKREPRTNPPAHKNIVPAGSYKPRTTEKPKNPDHPLMGWDAVKQWFEEKTKRPRMLLYWGLAGVGVVALLVGGSIVRNGCIEAGDRWNYGPIRTTQADGIILKGDSNLQKSHIVCQNNQGWLFCVINPHGDPSKAMIMNLPYHIARDPEGKNPAVVTLVPNPKTHYATIEISFGADTIEITSDGSQLTSKDGMQQVTK